MAAAVTAATSGGTFANDATIGTIDWDTPSNASASDNTRASATLLLSEITKYLKATNFGFSIPTGSTIRGIVVEVEKSSALATTVEDNSVKIVKGGTISGDNKAAAGAWDTTDTYASYGSATDLWGVTWTAEDINNSGFGVVVAADATAAGTARIDHIRITIHYTDLQANFAFNIPYLINIVNSISANTLLFAPFNLYESISLKTLNIAISADGTAKTMTFKLGLYSLTNSSLSILNSFSGSYTNSNQLRYLSFTDVSATSNLTPGTWFWGMLVSFSSTSNVSYHGGFTVNPANAFAGNFIGGRMTASTSELPSTYNTSDLDTTGSDGLFVPVIILSA